MWLMEGKQTERMTEGTKVHFVASGEPSLISAGQKTSREWWERSSSRMTVFSPFFFMPAHEELQDQIHHLRQRVKRLERRLRKETLCPVRDLAEEENRWPDTYNGVVALMERVGVPKRNYGGREKKKGSRRRTYVSVYELKKRCQTSES